MDPENIQSPKIHKKVITIMNLLIGSDNTHHQKGVSLWEQGRAPRLYGLDTLLSFIFLNIELILLYKPTQWLPRIESSSRSNVCIQCSIQLVDGYRSLYYLIIVISDTVCGILHTIMKSSWRSNCIHGSHSQVFSTVTGNKWSHCYTNYYVGLWVTAVDYTSLLKPI